MSGQLSIFLLLGICSYEDLKRKQIRTAWLAVFAGIGILYAVFTGNRLFAEIALALIPGCCVLALSVFMRGEIGQGDGLLLLVMGFFLDAVCLCMILLSALFLSAVYALFLYYIKKKNRNYEIAFVPFILAAYIWNLYNGR